jgi:hypothetical protein
VAALSVVTGVVSGLMAKTEILPTIIWHKLILKRDIPSALPYEKALDYLDAHLKDLCDGSPFALMKVYPIGRRDEAVVGEYAWGYGKTGEVILNWTTLLKDVDLTKFYKSIVVNDPVSNRIFEIYPMSKDEMQELIDEKTSAFATA